MWVSVKPSDSDDDYIPDFKSHTASESDDEVKVSPRVTKQKKRPRSRDLPTATHLKAPDSTTKCAVFEGAVHSEQGMAVFNDRSSKTRREKEEELMKEEVEVEHQGPGDLRAYGDGPTRVLPPRLVEMWTQIDPALPHAEILDIFQTTFAEWKLAIPLGGQPWMQANNKSSAVAIEKARIANYGKIPDSWKRAAEQSEHGRKWLRIEERAAALDRARYDMARTAADEAVAREKVVATATEYNEINRQAQNALEDSQSAATQAKEAAEWAKEAAKRAMQAKKAADQACKKVDQAQSVFLECKATRDRASLAASSAAAEVKALEEKAKGAATVEPPGKKRKLGAYKAEDA